MKITDTLFAEAQRVSAALKAMIVAAPNATKVEPHNKTHDQAHEEEGHVTTRRATATHPKKQK